MSPKFSIQPSPRKRADEVAAAVAREAVAPEAMAPEATVVRGDSGPRPKATAVPLAIVPEATAGHTRFSNTLLDDLLPTLDPYEQLVFLRLTRLSWGFGRPECKVGYAKLSEKTRLSRKTIQRTLARLEQRGLVRRLSTDALSSDKGSVYAVAMVGEAIAREAMGARQARAPRAIAPEAPMKDSEKKTETTLSVYDVRVVAARLYEVHRTEPGFDAARLRELVRAALTGQGTAADERTIAEATRGMT